MRLEGSSWFCTLFNPSLCERKGVALSALVLGIVFTSRPAYLYYERKPLIQARGAEICMVICRRPPAPGDRGLLRLERVDVSWG